LAEKKAYKPRVCHLPTDLLESICDFYFCSEQDTEDYVCYLACKMTGKKKIKILKVGDLDDRDECSSDHHTINFFNALSDDFMIKIKELDGNIVTVFVNGTEQFLVSMSNTGE
jgi:hypothetical protein